MIAADIEALWPFQGFASPHYTQVPDEFLDIVAPRLTEAELRVALYIIRRTFGFKKEADTISVKQMVDGIVGRDGTRLDHGTGMQKSSVMRALRGLKDKGVIIAEQNTDPIHGNRPTTYALHMLQAGTATGITPSAAGGTTPVPLAAPPSYPERYPQEIGVQETVDKKQNPPTPRRGEDGIAIPSEMAQDPGDSTGESPRVPDPPPAPSQALEQAEARILDFPRLLDRQSKAMKASADNGWSEQPPERLERLRDGAWARWRDVNPERITRKDLALLGAAVAPDEAERFKARTRAYLDTVSEPRFLKSFRRWLEEWRDWSAPAASESSMGPIAQVREMAEATRRINRKEATG